MNAATKQWIKILLLISLAIAGIIFIWYVRSGLYPFIVAFLLAYVLNPSICKLEDRGWQRSWAILAVYVVLFSLIFLFGFKVLPLLIKEVEGFSKDIPYIASNFERIIDTMEVKYQNSNLPYSLRLAIDDAIIYLESGAQNFVENIVNGVIGCTKYLIGIAVTPVLAFYILQDWHKIKNNILNLFPVYLRSELLLFIKDIDKVLNGVIRGQVLIALVVGIMVSVTLYLFHVKYALLIGIFAGILDLIPYFGAIIGAVPAVTLALMESPLLALKVAVLFFFIHQIESTIIQPQILSDSVGLHPLAVIFFVFVGGEIGGISGMVLGVPLAAIGKVLLKHVISYLVR